MNIAVDLQTNETVALKRVHVRVGATELAKLRNEISMLRRCANIANVIGWRGAYCGARQVWIAMEVGLCAQMLPLVVRGDFVWFFASSWISDRCARSSTSWASRSTR